MAGNFEYDSELDALYIYNSLDNEEIMGSIPFGSLVFDISKSGKLVGLEIDNASVFLKIGKEQLSKINSTSLFIRKQGDMLMLGYAVILDKKEYNFAYAIPQKKIAITC